MYKIKFFNFLSTATYSESKARLLFDKFVETYGIENIKLVYIGKGV